jgi:hypothetical protein
MHDLPLLFGGRVDNHLQLTANLHGVEELHDIFVGGGWVGGLGTQPRYSEDND